ncbi:MAG: Ig-like domain-containing protein [Bacteriovorax sp.]|jgi:hypothetical protein
MNNKKFINIFFLSAVAVAMSACVPKATEKKAVCGENEAFSSVSRTCYSIVAPNKAPVAANIAPASFVEDTQSIITLSYSDVDLDLATTCQISNLSHVTLTQACSCTVLGLCTVGVTGTTDYVGAGSFTYSVLANNMTSNSATASLTLTNVNDAPTIPAIAAQTTNEDTAKAVSFSIADVDSTVTCAGSVTATASTDAALVPLANIVITGSGTSCTATITPVANLNGASNITLQVTDGFLTATQTFAFNVTAVNDAPVILADNLPATSTIFLNQTINEDAALVYHFTMSDVDSALSCVVNLSYTSSDPLLTVVYSAVIPTLDCNATITPPANYYGTSNITITLDDLSGAGNAQVNSIFTLTVTAINDRPTIALIGAQVILENSTAVPSSGAVDVVVDQGDAVFEATQILSMTVTSDTTTLVPNTLCQNYTPGAGTPVGTQTPASAGVYYFDKTAKACYVSTGTTNADWDLYPSLTAIPGCIADADYEAFGLGAPSAALVPTAAGKYYLDTTNNKCYISLSTTAGDWAADNTLTDFFVSYVPVANQSGAATITMALTDDGGTSNGGADTANANLTFALTVTAVDDQPYFSADITTSDTNEGGMVVAGPFNIDEDEGSTADEDVQAISITSIVSDNTSVLPSATNPNATSSIRIFYDLNDNGVEDTGEDRNLAATLEAAAADDAKGHSFYLKLYPIAGIAGNSNITITATDGTTPITSIFSLIVHPVAALHGGWANISAVGIKTDKNGVPASTDDVQCNYNLSTDDRACDTNQNCTGTSAPNGSITPDAVSVLYYDSANKKCYRSMSTSKFSWVDITTACPVTRISVTPTTLSTTAAIGATSLTVASTTGFPTAGTITIGSEDIAYTGKTATTFTGLLTTAVHTAADAVTYTADGDNFIKDATATPAQGIPVPTDEEQYYFDAATKLCYASDETAPGVWGWGATPYVPSKVTLAWNAFTVTGSGADSSVSTFGWNVYRREAGSDYDFQNGYLKIGSTDTMSISDATVRTFTDTTAFAGKVYYYLVRPVDSTTRHLSISTPEVFSEVRVLAPAENYSFVHRWMANQEVCNSMHMTTTTTNKVDPTKNYRCPYTGPGQVTVSGSNYYDIGKDMLVDISESSCPYTPAPECTANGCIGIGNPTTLGYTATNGSVYYDRDSGSCWYDNAGVWTDANSGAGAVFMAAKKVESALNPPLVNISKTNAAAVCTGRSTAAVTASLGIANGAAANPPAAHSLPTKKEYIAYAAAPIDVTDSVLTDMEQGFSLNIESRCNSSSANGLEVAYTDSNIPSTSFIYSLPGTSSSGIRSLYTGSVPWVSNYSTETCSSRYGVQDVYGNVAEWVRDSMTCNVLANTTLAGAITAAATSITVVDATQLNLGDITIGSEDMTITLIAGNVLTVTRGVNSTTAADHAITELVYDYEALADNFLCKTVGAAAGTDLERFDYALDDYNNAAVSTSYAFDLITGPYDDTNADSAMSLGDGFLSNWDFRDELFNAGKFNFPMGMPMNVDIASTAVGSSSAIDFLMDIGPTSGITTNQLHEDGIIVSGATVNDITANPTQTGSFAQGGSYLSGNFAGRYSSELVPDADIRPDVGFRCYIPVDSTNFPADAGRHTYSY